MGLPQFTDLLQQAIGLDAESIGTSSVERAVQARLSACKLRDAGAYWEFLNDSPAELQLLIEEVVVPETWFFRDREAFVALATHAEESWLRAHPEGRLRVLSVPCSTGEEPYSIAMALLDAGFASDRFAIDAVDVSSRVLTRAREAVYGKNSFRSAELAFRDRHFDLTPQGYHLHGNIRRQVSFHQGNLFAIDATPGLGGYDVIFCRNLLIYFDRAGQDRAVHVLRSLLASGGVMFVGPSESGLLLDHDFVSLKMRLAFAFAAPAPRASVAAAPPPPPASKINAPARLPVPQRKPQVVMPAPRSPQGQAAQGLSLQDISRLADRGQLGDAAQACETWLRTQGPTVDALHLLGLICAAAGELDAATQHYRKALYLDPTHCDTLLHLGLLLEKRGDAVGARLLRERLARLPGGAAP